MLLIFLVAPPVYLVFVRIQTAYHAPTLNRPAADEKKEPVNGLEINENPSPDEPVDGLVITLNGERVATVVDRKEPWASRFLSGAGDMIGAGARGIIEINNADPSFALTQVARTIEPLVMQGMPRNARAKFENIYPGVLKGISAGLNVVKWIQRRQRSELAKADGSYNDFDRLGEIVDTAHLASDAVGIAGAVTRWAAPASSWGGAMLGISLAADIGVYAFHAIEYIGTKDEGQQEPPPGQDPPPES